MRCLIVACFSAFLFACGSSSTTGAGGGGAGGASTDGGGGMGGAANGGASQTGGGGSGGEGGTSENGGSGGAPTTDTWANFGQAFFKKYCVECHAPGDSTGDFNKLADVMRNSSTIRCGVASMTESGCGPTPPPKQFPIGNGPKPTDAERDRVVAWIAAGLP